jgi:predicted AlkP superfamily phosphohydrolase/phosphomutase
MTHKKKVIIIGIDGLDADLLLRFRDSLPNFSDLMQKSPTLKMYSTFPPDSPTAWASIFTGLSPAKHGIVSFKDPLSHSEAYEYLRYTGNLVGRTFWDFAGTGNKKCCIVFPHSGYPPWPVNGVMVSRTTEADMKKFGIKTYPSGLSLGSNPNRLKPITSFPTDPGQAIEPTKKVILDEVDFGLNLFSSYEWDIFFIYFSSLDNIQHMFWRYFDQCDPDYPDLSRYKDVIPSFYRFYDEHVVGRFLKKIRSEDAFLVLSDHGHGMRPYKVVNINEFLINAGYMRKKIKSSSLSDMHYLQNFMKERLTGLVNERRILAKLVSKILSLFPRSLEFYTSVSPIDWNKTTAYLSDSSAGLKTYSYAGIRIKENGEASSYEKIRQAIIDLLLKIKSPSSTENLVEWAVRREELYQGPFIFRYPDVVFKLREDWGAGWEMNGLLYSRSLSHKLFSGNHKQNSAVFLMRLPNQLRIKTDKVMLTDVTPTILDLLEIDEHCSTGSFDGKTILRKCTM